MNKVNLRHACLTIVAGLLMSVLAFAQSPQSGPQRNIGEPTKEPGTTCNGVTENDVELGPVYLPATTALSDVSSLSAPPASTGAVALWWAGALTALVLFVIGIAVGRLPARRATSSA